LSNFSAISWQEQVTFNEIMMYPFVIDQHYDNELKRYGASSQKQQFMG